MKTHFAFSQDLLCSELPQAIEEAMKGDERWPFCFIHLLTCVTFKHTLQALTFCLSSHCTSRNCGIRYQIGLHHWRKSFRLLVEFADCFVPINVKATLPEIIKPAILYFGVKFSACLLDRRCCTYPLTSLEPMPRVLFHSFNFNCTF